MSKFLISRLSSLEEYVPGEQPRDKKYIKLNTNESPFPPSPKAMAVIDAKEKEDLRLYSDPEAKKLKEEIASYYDTDIKNVFVSNGSDEALNFFFMAFCDDTNKVCFPNISYGFYKVFANLYSLPYEEIPLKDDFSINPTDYFNKGKNIVIANPNAPTGLTLSLFDIEEIVATNPNNLVVIDEAYVDFGAESAVPLTKKYNNLLVVQTFSKSRSLAGARLGFAIGNEEIIKDLEKIKFSTNPYNINRLTMLLGQEAIKDEEYFDINRRLIIEAREFTKNALEEMDFTVLPSKANFLFVKSDKISGEELYLKLKEKSILVRHFKDEKISAYNRITIGTMDEMKSLIKAIKEIML